MDQERVVNLIPLLGSFDDSGVVRFSEIKVNILAFIPLEIYLCMLKAPWPLGKKILTIIVLTLAFEITQFIFAIGRADVTDVLSNTLGGVIGIGIYALLFELMKDRTNMVLNVLAAAALAILFVVLLLVNRRWVRIT